MSHSSAVSRGGNIGKRRNGLQPACENCRKAKVRCDITPSEPICARCRKQKKQHCIFLEAPMTQTRHAPPVPAFQAVHTPPYASPAFSNTTSTPKSDCSVSTASRSTRTGYLGMTSYSATLRNSGLQSSVDDADGDADSDMPKPDAREVALGVEVLRYLPDERTCSLFLEFYVTHTVGLIGMPRPVMRHILASMFSTFGTSLSLPRSEQELEKVSRNISEMGHSADSESDEPGLWIDMISDRHVRWDIVGILFVAFAYAIMVLPDEEYAAIDPRMAHEDRKVCIRIMKTCVENCMELSRHSLRHMVCNLIYKNLILETVIEGDSSLSVWRLHHDLVAVATAIGIHCYQGTTQVSVASELSKRLSACVFRCDKDIAMFTGRPPALNHRYYTCPLPLDLDDEVLMAGGETLQREVDALDKNGWNQKGAVYDATIYRMMFLSAMIQDEIMELFVENAAQFSMKRVNDLKARVIETFAPISYLIGSTEDMLLALKSDFYLWRLAYCRMDYLRLHFLLERLSVERGHESKQKLLDTSRTMVDLTVFLWLNRDRSSTRYYGFDYFIICYGMPSTGILCTELLKQVRYPKTVDVKLSCSEVVQSLSMMIKFLEWIEPGTGNYKLCQHMSQVVKRVLEQVFEPPPAEEVPVNNHQIHGFDSNIWGIDGDDDFDWLNSIDWGRGPFPEMTSWGSSITG